MTSIVANGTGLCTRQSERAASAPVRGRMACLSWTGRQEGGSGEAAGERREPKER
jgi:hypothetical protein